MPANESSRQGATKALVFFPHNPYPPRTGAHQRCLAIIGGLRSLGCAVTLSSSTIFTDAPWDEESIKGLSEAFGIEVDVHVPSPEDLAHVRRHAQAGESIAWEQFTPPGLVKRFTDLYRSLQPDIVLINYAFWGALALGREFDRAIRIVDTHDLLTLNLAMRTALEARMEHGDEFLDEDFFEKLAPPDAFDEYWLYDQFDHVLAIANPDATELRRNLKRSHVAYLPMTFAVREAENTSTEPPVFVIGDNPFNVQGYRYFVKKVLPRIHEELPAFALRVVGAGCHRLAPQPGITLEGFVADLSGLYAKSAFAVCPLLGGTGMKVKIVEAMANGLPVVSTRQAAEGSPIVHGVNGFVARDADEFARYVLQLAGDPELCRRLGLAARRTIAEEFSQVALLTRLEPLLRTRAEDYPPAHLLPDRKAFCFFLHPDWNQEAWKSAVSSYCQAFSPHDDVSLVIWADPSQGVGVDQIYQRLEELLATLGIDSEQCPDILLVPQPMDPSELLQLKRSMDCLVPGLDQNSPEYPPALDRLEVEAWRNRYAQKR